MLRISKKADYAVFVLGAIARQGAYPGGPAGNTVVSAHEIARQAGLNKSVVANLLKEFAKHGLLDSVRGLRGGYRLARVPADVSLGQILEVVEGRFALVDCIEHGGDRNIGDRNIGDRNAGDRNAGDRREGSQGPGLLPLSAASKRSVGHTQECSLIAFCPSKSPMRIVHERVSRLFDQIRLDELCSLSPMQLDQLNPVQSSTTASTPATATRAAPTPLAFPR
ncbi:MAG: Rrf2 family transcriptional regulator [Planctomycetota bacterium]